MQACQVTLIGSVTHSFHCLHTLTLVRGAFVTYHTHSAKAYIAFFLWRESSKCSLLIPHCDYRKREGSANSTGRKVKFPDTGQLQEIMSPVCFLKHTIFPEVGQGTISYTLFYTCPEVFQGRCTESKESVQEIAPCPKLQEI